ncbi:MAG TPA: GAP family protein [Solirubrobacteraceae bacterium]|nr:GAP family protein [Solirubrobacteraceae bacterium]
MPAQAITLALAGSIYPPALAVAVAIAGGPKVRLRLSIFTLVAVLTTYLLGIAILELFAGLHLGTAEHVRGGAVLQALVGVALIGLGVYLQLRKRPVKDGPSRVERYMASVPLIIVLGVSLYALPSPQYIGAVKAISGQAVPRGQKLVQLLLCVAIMLWMIEVPAALLFALPRHGERALTAFHEWLTLRGRFLVIAICYCAGAWLTVNGVLHAA